MVNNSPFLFFPRSPSTPSRRHPSGQWSRPAPPPTGDFIVSHQSTNQRPLAPLPFTSSKQRAKTNKQADTPFQISLPEVKLTSPLLDSSIFITPPSPITTPSRRRRTAIPRSVPIPQIAFLASSPDPNFSLHDHHNHKYNHTKSNNYNRVQNEHTASTTQDDLPPLLPSLVSRVSGVSRISQPDRRSLNWSSSEETNTLIPWGYQKFNKGGIMSPSLTTNRRSPSSCSFSGSSPDQPLPAILQHKGQVIPRSYPHCNPQTNSQSISRPISQSSSSASRGESGEGSTPTHDTVHTPLTPSFSSRTTFDSRS